MKTVFIKVIIYVKNKERKYTQISAVGAAVPRQVMKRKARNPCKKRFPNKSERRRCDRCSLCRPYGTRIVNQSF